MIIQAAALQRRVGWCAGQTGEGVLLNHSPVCHRLSSGSTKWGCLTEPGGESGQLGCDD